MPIPSQSLESIALSLLFRSIFQDIVSMDTVIMKIMVGIFSKISIVYFHPYIKKEPLVSSNRLVQSENELISILNHLYKSRAQTTNKSHIFRLYWPPTSYNALVIWPMLQQRTEFINSAKIFSPLRATF